MLFSSLSQSSHLPLISQLEATKPIQPCAPVPYPQLLWLFISPPVLFTLLCSIQSAFFSLLPEPQQEKHKKHRRPSSSSEFLCPTVLELSVIRNSCVKFLLIPGTPELEDSKYKQNILSILAICFLTNMCELRFLYNLANLSKFLQKEQKVDP